MSKRGTPDTEVEVDMTPMIDLTFLLIIFFIIVNDLTQQELEDLKLPIAQEAGHDDDRQDVRPHLEYLLRDANILHLQAQLQRVGEREQQRGEEDLRGIPSSQ